MMVDVLLSTAAVQEQKSSGWFKKNKYSVASINTTDGKRYFLLRDGKVSLSHREYYKKKSTAQKKANKLNKS